MYIITFYILDVNILLSFYRVYMVYMLCIYIYIYIYIYIFSYSHIYIYNYIVLYAITVQISHGDGAPFQCCPTSQGEHLSSDPSRRFALPRAETFTVKCTLYNEKVEVNIEHTYKQINHGLKTASACPRVTKPWCKVLTRTHSATHVQLDVNFASTYAAKHNKDMGL